MTKAEVIWLLIRVAGLYFIYQSIEVAISTFGVLLVASEAPGVMSKSAGVLLPAIIRIVFYAWLGIYLLNDGSKFFQMLNRRPDDVGQ
jgi:hypothetical protein